MNRNNVPQSPSQTQAQSVASISSLYFPLPAPFFHAQPLPIPVISPRSQSSFSQAAAVIANFGQVQPELSSYSSGSSSGSGADSGVSNSSGHTSGEHPRECYLDIEEDGTVVKKFSPRSSARPSVATSSTSIPFTSTPLFLARGKSGDRSGGGEATGVTNTTSTSSLYDSSAPPSSLSFLSSAAASVSSSSSTGGGGSGPLSFPPPDLTSSASNVSRMSSTTSTFDKFVEAIGTVDDHDSHDSHDKLPQDQLAMLREASADSDI